MLKFLMNVLFAPNDARHITHCPKAELEISKERVATTNRIERMRRTFMSLTPLSPAKAGSRNSSLVIPALKRWATLKSSATRTKIATYLEPSADGGGPLYRRFFERKLSGKKTNSRQMQITTAGTMVRIKLIRSNRRCMK